MQKMIPTVLLLAVCGSSPATTISFDFDSGVDPASFSVFNVGDLFTVDTDPPDLRVSKPADDGTILPNDFINGGIESSFTFDGDFTITVDFALHDFPPTPGSIQINASVLAIVPEGGGLFEIVRLRVGSEDLIETFATPGGFIQGAPSTLYSGRYRITRSGSTLTAYFSEPGKSPFTPFGTIDAFPGPYRVQLVAAQGMSNGSRSTTALNVSFDNLVIEADQIHFLCHADINGDGVVNVVDLVRLLLCFGQPAAPVCEVEDVNGDGNINVLDLVELLLAFGTTCP